MADLELSYLLPMEELVPARVLTDYLFSSAQLEIGGKVVLEGRGRAELERGVDGTHQGHRLLLRLDGRELRLSVDGESAPRIDKLRAPPTRSAWFHALLALCGSLAGFVASWLYLKKAAFLSSEWSFKMGQHTLGWHLLLTATLFPASVWGQRIGIRAVQLVSCIFFVIHAGMAIANLGRADAPTPYDVWIACFNAASGLLFAAAALYGQRAWRDMDPVVAARRRLDPARSSR